MDIKEEHKSLLIELGITQEDFDLFDGKIVNYEYDEDKGVRLFDPYYRTSYKEYIGIDGWSSWSSEGDTFMTDVLEKVHAEVKRVKESRPGPEPAEVSEALEKKFVKKR